MAGIDPRKDSEYLRRKLRDLTRRVRALESSSRIDASVGTGMGRPWLSLGSVLHFPPDDPNNFPGTSSSSYVILASTGGFVQHANLLVYLNWFIPDASTSGQYRIQVRESTFEGPDPDPTFFTVGTFNGPNGGTGNPVVIPASVGFGALTAVFVEARRTAGSGTVHANLGGVWGVGLRDNPYPVLEAD